MPMLCNNQLKMGNHDCMEILLKILLKIAIFLAILIVYFVGNMVIGKFLRGGKRLMLMVIGLLFGGIGAVMFALIYDGSISTYFYMLILICVWIAVWYCGVALFGSNSTTDKTFKDLSDGF